MKLKSVFPVLPVLLVGLFTSCAKDMGLDSNAKMASSETKNAATAQQQAPIELGISGDFAILSKSGITNVYKSSITGDIGASPISGAAILVSCAEVTGTIFSVDAAGPLPCAVNNATRLTSAIGTMQTAYTDGAGRNHPDFLNLGAGNIGGKTLTPGLYKWTSAVVIPTDITIAGSDTDVWIFQIAGTLNMSAAVRMTLTGGALAKNIFWVTAGAATFGTTSHVEGTILSQTGVNLQTGASINGRMLAQTAVTLQMNTVVKPQ